MDNYEPNKTEPKWQKFWEKSNLSRAEDFSQKPKLYLLVEFPYPSGEGLHVGHCRPYTALDVVARKKRMEGYNVLFPMGWDAFGLPTENYAVKTGIHPAKATEQNVANFKRQQKMLGLSFDWPREIYTTDPAYYKWTQWIFLKLFEKGLAYKDKMPINWCPACKIGLANEEVVDGRCERCGEKVIQKEKEQWMIKITLYAQRLVDDLTLVDFPERVKILQRDWIGRSEGYEVIFKLKIKNEKLKITDKNLKINVFTTRINTIFGCTYLVLAPENPLVKELKPVIVNCGEVEKYVEQTKAKSEIERQAEVKEKTGVKLEGVTAVNPANGKEIPIFVADYVLMGYGTGAIMAVPGHDQRDFEFAIKYDLPIIEVIRPKDISKSIVLGLSVKEGFKEALKENSISFESALSRNDREHIRVTLRDKEIEKFIDLLNKFLLDRWWVETIGSVEKMIFKDKGKMEIFDNFLGKPEEIFKKCQEWEPLVRDEKNIWQMLDHNLFYHGFICYEEEGILVNSGDFNRLESKTAIEKIGERLKQQDLAKKAVNYKLRDWIFSRQRYWGEPIPLVFCERCGWVAVPEENLPVELPEVEDFKPTESGESPLAKVEKWVNTKCPKCGGKAKRETDVMPNWAGSNWYYLAYTMPRMKNEKLKIKNDNVKSKKNANAEYVWDEKRMRYWMPVDWYNGGMEHTTLHLLYSRFIYKFLWDIGEVPKELGPEPYKKRTSHGLVLAEGGVKMSKSKGNVINPEEVVKQYGADTLRVYEMFMGPFEQAIAWDTQGVKGVRRFLDKICRLKLKIKNEKLKTTVKNEKLNKLLHQTIQKVNKDIEAMKFNTAVSALMILVQGMEKEEAIPIEIFEKFLLILAPFAPHLSEELWQKAGCKESIFLQEWPKYDKKLIEEEKITLIVQIDGKVRDKIEMARGISESGAREMAMKSSKVKRWFGDKEIKKVIFIKDKLINFVL